MEKKRGEKLRCLQKERRGKERWGFFIEVYGIVAK